MAGARGIAGFLTPARGRPGEASGAGTPPRPEGVLVWFHAATRAHAAVAMQLADQLVAAQPGLTLLLTAQADHLPDQAGAAGVVMQALPADSAGAAQAFLSHWAPDLCVWSLGDLKPALLMQAHRRGIPLYLVDADEARLSRPGWRLLPDATRAVLKRFSVIMARSAATESFLRRRIGLREANIAVTGPLREVSRPLPCNESDHEELSRLLGGRPVWLAARLQPEELGAVLQADSAITRLSHRVLLVIAPAEPENSAPFHAALRRHGLRYVTWSEGTLPDETTEAILADTPGEMGLWYRLASISFMGGSLMSGAHGSDPHEAAAHGSAILYGPNIRNHLAAYSRFAEAGAARIVRDADTLADAVQRVIPPDQSAAMAHAAWDVATQGAEVMDRLSETILKALDARRRAR